MSAIQKLNTANVHRKYICVGLDTDPQKIPSHLLSLKNPVLEFNKRIIDSTKDLAAAYKLNLAFYESNGVVGTENLIETLSMIPDDILTIADGKRGDIGNTSTLYARAIYDHFNFDSATLNPYMGHDSMEPFLSYTTKLNFILVLTSNPGSVDFQKQKMKTENYLYQEVLKKIQDWDSNANCGIVFGATNISELKENLDLIKKLPLLIPGVGAQGGNLQDIVSTLFNSGKNRFLINVSRGIIQKSLGEDFAEAARKELISLNNTIEQIPQHRD